MHDKMLRAEDATVSQDPQRRELLASLGALGITQALGTSAVHAQTASDPLRGGSGGKPRRIDVHHHILPPEYVSMVGKEAIAAPAPNREVPVWTVQNSLDVMDQYGVTAAVVSVSAPGVWFKEKNKAQRVARICNEFAAGMGNDHPGRFGFFAALPLPDIESSIAELNHALDDLHCDGIGLMTQYGERFLGDPLFAPLFDELNRRKAVVYVHPTYCECDATVLPQIPASMIEFPHNTTRAIVSLIFSGTFARCPDIRFIFSHAGGTLPYIASRIAGVGAVDRGLAHHIPNGVLPILQKQYYDTALSVNPFTLPLLLKLVSANNVLLGTDYPFSMAGVKLTVEGLQSLGLDAQELRAIESKNAAALLPRFGG